MGRVPRLEGRRQSVCHWRVGGRAAGQCPKHEAGSHAGELDDRLVLEPERVHDVDRHVGDQDEAQLPGGRRRAERHPADEEQDAGHEGHGGRQGAAGHGSVALAGVLTIRVDVLDVVEQIGARGHEQEGEEGHDRGPQDAAVEQGACGGRSDEDEQVLDPLPRSHGGDQRAKRRSRAAPPTICREVGRLASWRGRG